MKVHQFSDSLVFETPTVATLGTFDGLHLGHQKIITDVVDEAGKRGAECVVVTFDRHPAELLLPLSVPLFLSSFVVDDINFAIFFDHCFLYSCATTQ